MTTPLIAPCLLALDLGAHLGWAMWFNGTVTSGTTDLSKSHNKRFEGPGMKFVRFARFVADLPRPTLVSFEEVRRHLGTDAAHAYGGYLSHLTAFCDTQDPPIPYEGIPVATIKKRATGRGNAPKEDMIAACRGRLNYEPVDDNEADARWLLLLMCEASKLKWPGPAVPEPPTKAKPRRRKAATKT